MKNWKRERDRKSNEENQETGKMAVKDSNAKSKVKVKVELKTQQAEREKLNGNKRDWLIDYGDQ